MRVAIAGGHGQVAMEVTRLLSAHGHEVRSTSRDDGQLDVIERAGGSPVIADIEAMTSNELADAVGPVVAYLRAKGRADRDLRDSGVGYSIVRPTRLTDEEPVGTVSLSPDADGDAISRADVAAVLAGLLETGEPIQTTVQLTAGDTPVDETVSALFSK